MGNNSSNDIPNDVIKCIIEFIPQVYLLSVIRVNKRISGLVLSTIKEDPFLNACENGKIITLFRYYNSQYVNYHIGLDFIINVNNFDLVKMIYEKKIYRFWELPEHVNILEVDFDNYWVGEGLHYACKYLVRKISDEAHITLFGDKYISMIEYFINMVPSNLNHTLMKICAVNKTPGEIGKQVQLKVIKMLLDKGATDVYADALGTVVDSNNLEAIKLLIDLPHTNRYRDLDILLCRACRANADIDTILFIKSKGNIDLNVALNRACNFQDLKTMNILIQLGADPAECDCGGVHHELI